MMRRKMLAFFAMAVIAILAACSPSVPVTGSNSSSAAPTMLMPTSGSTPEPTTAALAATSAAPSPTGTEVEISDYAFNPGTLTIKAGTTVKWTNKDVTAHTVTADDKSFDSGNMDPGQTFSFTFQQPGTFSYFCAIHPNMTAKIVVTGG